MGAGLATLVGGTLIAAIPPVSTALTGPLEPWRVVFILVGLPGIAIALLVFSLREPRRRGDVSAGVPPFAQVARYVWERRDAYGATAGGRMPMCGSGRSRPARRCRSAWRRR